MNTTSAQKRRIRRHIVNLDSPDEEVSLRAGMCLTRYYGARALDELLDACEHSNPVVRFRAVMALGRTKDSRAFDTILRLTDDADERVRYDAVIALGLLGDPRAGKPLMRMLYLDDVTRPAGSALVTLGEKMIPYVEQAFRHENVSVRWIVVNALGNYACDYGNKRARRLVKEACKDPDAHIRADAKSWMEEIEGRAID